MTEDVKLNFFKKLVISVKDLDKYDLLAAQPVKKGISYFIKLILLFSTVLAMMYSIQVFQLSNKAKEKIDEVPDFEYKNGELVFNEDEPILFENITNLLNSVLIIPNENDENSKEYSKKIKTYNSYLILNKSDFAISINDNKLDFKYKDVLDRYSIKSFDKAELKDLISTINSTTLSFSFFLLMIIYLFFWYLIMLGSDIIITFLVSSITSWLARIKLKISALVNIAIHSLTLSILLYLAYYIVNILTGFEIKNFRIMYVLVASIYAAISILIIKADFIERQVELAKVIKEQQAIRKELADEDDNDIDDEEDGEKKEEPVSEDLEIGTEKNIE